MRNSWDRRRSLSTKIRVVATASALVLLAATAAIAAPGVTPSSVETTLAAGGSTVVPKSVETPTISPRPDIIFLADTTGSMGAAIAPAMNCVIRRWTMENHACSGHLSGLIVASKRPRVRAKPGPVEGVGMERRQLPDMQRRLFVDQPDHLAGIAIGDEER